MLPPADPSCESASSPPFEGHEQAVGIIYLSGLPSHNPIFDCIGTTADPNLNVVLDDEKLNPYIYMFN